MLPLRLLRLCIVQWILVIGHWSFAAAPAAAPHPRLFLDAAQIPGLRERAATERGARLLESIRWMRDGGDAFGTQTGKAFGNDAALYLATGDRAYADLARDEFLFHVANREVWANPGFRSLTRGAITRGAAISYDLCHNAWAGQTVPASVTVRGETRALPAELVGQDLNRVASRALLDSARALNQSGGPGWPGNQRLGNNWFAVRYGSAILALLACDEPEEETREALQTALRHLRNHLRTAYSTHRDAAGWNPEGYGYTFYPAQFTYPAALALARLRQIRLADEIPALRASFGALHHGLLPLPTRFPGPLFGLRPDFTDDHNHWLGEGFANLAFAFAPADQIPGLRWLYRRSFGELGDARYDTASVGGLWALLHLDLDGPEKNPADIPSLGLSLSDPHHGYYSFRKSFGDDPGQDVLSQFMAKHVLSQGGHAGPDGLGFRLWGLGTPWTVGSGRTHRAGGQCTVFTADPGDERHRSQAHRTVSSLLRPAGGGYVVARSDPLSDVGVRDHVRRFIVDYRPETGAEAAWIVADTSADGRIWRMNTPGKLEDGRAYNVITHDAATATFTITNQFNGHRLVGRVLHPERPVFRTGTFTRGNATSVPLDRATGASLTENAWIDFGSADGAFVVALTLHRKGQPAPAVSSTVATDGAREIRIGQATYTIDGDGIRVRGW